LLCPLPTLFNLSLLLLCAFPLLSVQLLLALLRNTLLLLHLPLPVDILLTFLPPAVLFHLPLLLFLSLHLPAVSLRLPWFLAAARLWPVLRPLGSPSILILLVSILFAVWLILLRMAGNTRRKKQTHNRSSHNSDALHVASKHLDA